MVASGRTLLLLQILCLQLLVHGLDEYVNRAQSAVDLQIPLLPSEENVSRGHADSLGKWRGCLAYRRGEDGRAEEMHGGRKGREGQAKGRDDTARR